MVRCPASSGGGGSRRASAASAWSLLSALVVLLVVAASSASGASVSSGGSSQRSACLRNCHLCEQMYGDHFEGHLCAHTCVRLGGRLAPDCTDFASIAPFLADLGNIV